MFLIFMSKITRIQGNKRVDVFGLLYASWRKRYALSPNCTRGRVSMEAATWVERGQRSSGVTVENPNVIRVPVVFFGVFSEHRQAQVLTSYWSPDCRDFSDFCIYLNFYLQHSYTSYILLLLTLPVIWCVPWSSIRQLVLTYTCLYYAAVESEGVGWFSITVPPRVVIVYIYAFCSFHFYSNGSLTGTSLWTSVHLKSSERKQIDHL